MAKSYLDKDGLLYFLQLIRPNATPSMDGTASTGTAKRFALQDHVHPSDTTKAPLASPALTGTPTAPTAATGTTTTQIATTEFVANAVAASTSGVSDVRVDGTSVVSSGVANIGHASPENWGVVKVTMGVTAGDNYSTTDLQSDINGSVTTTKLARASVATTDKRGLMSAADKTKLDKLVFDGNNLIDSSILPSYVDDVIEAYPRSGQTELSQNWLSLTSGGSALTPETGKIYILMADSTSYATNTQFRWSGTAYVKMLDGGVTSITNAEIDTIVAS